MEHMVWNKLLQYTDNANMYTKRRSPIKIYSFHNFGENVLLEVLK